MPNRILRDGILTSDRVNLLDWAAEVFYRRLMSVVDDYGCYDARVSVLRSSLYPLRLDRVREADVQRWMADCQKAGLVVFYEAEGKRCLQLLDFRQQIRAKKSKWPQPLADACMCTQVQAYAHVVVDEDVGANAARAPDDEDGVSQAFEKFWKAYPARRGRKVQKKDAFAAFKKLKPEDWPEVMAAVSNYANETEFPKDAHRFLRNDGWKEWLGDPVNSKPSRVATDEDLENYDPHG